MGETILIIMMVISRRGGLNDWKVVGNITNQLKLQPPNIAAEKVSGEEVVATATVAEVLPVPKKTKVLVKGRGKKRGRYKTKLEPEPVPRSCKFCEANFPEEYLCLVWNCCTTFLTKMMCNLSVDLI